MMRYFQLKRIASSERGTFGVLIEGQIPFALTIEPPWKNNKKDISCIPEGSYLCKRINSPKFGNTFEITEVPDRENILFHWGNLLKDTLGCVVVGEEYGEINGEPVVEISRNIPGKGFNELMNKVIGDNEFMIRISNHFV